MQCSVTDASFLLCPPATKPAPVFCFARASSTGKAHREQRAEQRAEPTKRMLSSVSTTPALVAAAARRHAPFPPPPSAAAAAPALGSAMASTSLETLAFNSNTPNVASLASRAGDDERDARARDNEPSSRAMVKAESSGAASTSSRASASATNKGKRRASTQAAATPSQQQQQQQQQRRRSATPGAALQQRNSNSPESASVELDARSSQEDDDDAGDEQEQQAKIDRIVQRAQHERVRVFLTSFRQPLALTRAFASSSRRRCARSRRACNTRRSRRPTAGTRSASPSSSISCSKRPNAASCLALRLHPTRWRSHLQRRRRVIPSSRLTNARDQTPTCTRLRPSPITISISSSSSNMSRCSHSISSSGTSNSRLPRRSTRANRCPLPSAALVQPHHLEAFVAPAPTQITTTPRTRPN